MKDAFRVELSNRARKDLRGLADEVLARVLEHLRALALDPFSPGTIKLKGKEAYRLRVGDYRIVFEVDTETRVVTCSRWITAAPFTAAEMPRAPSEVLCETSGGFH